MADILSFTVLTREQLPRARVLARTVKSLHSDWPLWALLLDDPANDGALSGFDRVVTPQQLEIPDFRRWLFKHDAAEALAAVKAPMLQFLLQQGATRVMYFDPSIAVFHPLGSIARRLDTASILLTPQQLAVNEISRVMRDNELDSLRYGIFNLGFLGVRNDATGREFARWWSKMTARACYDQVEDGFYLDRRYCDLVPGLFDGVAILRDAGCNVGAWNLSRRHLSFGAQGELLANGGPLFFYQFNGDDMATEQFAGDNIEVYELLAWHRRQISEAACPTRPWRYRCFDQGEPIPRAARLLWRNRPDIAAAHEDPFATGDGSFHARLQRDMPGLLA